MEEPRKLYSEECGSRIRPEDVTEFVTWHTNHMKLMNGFKDECRRLNVPAVFVARCDWLFNGMVNYAITIRKIHAKHILCVRCADEDEEDFEVVTDFDRYERMNADELKEANEAEDNWEMDRHAFFDMYTEEHGYEELNVPFCAIVNSYYVLDNWANGLQDKYMACVRCGKLSA